jgi:cytochrome oxidase Cu insertion factor (SCO1/SenC/PrrC family)
MKEVNPSKNNWQIVLIIGLLFIIPVILAALFYTHKTWLPKHTLNHGQLISPPYSMRQLTLDPIDLHQQWGLLYVHTGRCDSLCQRGLYNMLQIQKALGKDMNRLQRLLVISQMDPIDDQLQRLLNDSKTLYKQVDPSVMNHRPDSPAAFYVIDPFGNIILAYTMDTKPEWILDDLKFLMGQIG